ncbi:sodium:solute symporter family protein [Cardinium endosymbiont of Dermatophagoides farinae]|uniref:sodium:solute symporter family protein n=1 Tax=Cardinium endosymbiont of Dermatophagoides farinae TaxID=2597823 RepID=UPI001CB93525|nr:sodium:solute symporter family protein [Cardinium endosymbiont of Dermatophagoides farinae]
MICFDISILLIGAFLLLTLVVGIYFSRQKTTFREHAVGNKQFATATLVATVLATAYSGGGLLRTVESVYNLGLWWIAVTLLTCLDAYLIGKLALRMGPFMKHLSIAETIGSIYGKYPRVMVALVSVCDAVIAVTMQITAMSKAITMCIDTVDPRIAAIISTLVLVFYSTFGGVRAVTFTDVLQFITFAVIIPLLAWFIFLKTGKSTVEIISLLQGHTKFQFNSLFYSSTGLMRMLLLMLSFLVGRMYPSIIQRVYMASGPLQARSVFTYVTICSAVIWSFIILIGIFAFVATPDLVGTEIWAYIVNSIPPIFKAFLAISLLAMAMSTADSNLNASAVMSIHDILEQLRGSKKLAQVNQLRLAKWATLVIGLSSMALAFYCSDLLILMYWALNCYVPIVIAPFILAIFGFRGSARTALIGMTVGVLTILAWNKWVEPSTGMDGSFLAMVANGLAMMAAHYLFKQPENSGWVKPDNEFKQMQQAGARQRPAQKEAIKNGWDNKKFTLIKLVPSHTTMVCMGFYLAITSLLAYFIAPSSNHGCWLILQLFGAACCLGYPFFYDIAKGIRSIPSWLIGLCWFMGLAIYLPLNLTSHWWYLVDPIFSLSLSLTHCALILWLFPLYLGVMVVATTLLVVLYPIAIGLSFALLSSLFRYL